MSKHILLALCFHILTSSLASADYKIRALTPPLASGDYKIGVGIADCTGPAADIIFMGYAKLSQKGCGIHLRQFSRAFIFDDGTKRAVFVSVDAGMMAEGVHQAVLSRLKHLYNGTYNTNNVILSGTHTHGGPGGFMMDFMYDLSCSGFVEESFDALVEGITKSITKAHDNMVEGNIYLSSGELLGTNINRSPSAYLLNPLEERQKYQYDVDKEMVQLQLVSSNGTLMGAISWFAVHGTSMNNSNCLVTSDNVGYASILLEKSRNKDSLIGQGRFVAAFASTNLGDVSPNIRGPRCVTTGEECTLVSSTCEGNQQFCVAEGPGKDMFESTKMIAERLFEKAKILLESSDSIKVQGPIRHIHQYVHMPSQSTTIQKPDGTIEKVHGCLPAMGYSFAAGTTDGAGEMGFSQAMRSTANNYWRTIRDIIFQPTQQDTDCHHPKPILINSGKISVPFQWQPTIVSTQIIQLGEVFLVAVPGEFTTMSGRRLRSIVRQTAVRSGASPRTKAVITGLSNIYSSYVATPEEYQMQRYEGASTIYGPHTLTLYLSIYRNLTRALLNDEKLPPGPTPPDLSDKVMSFVPPVMFDTSGLLNDFGDCIVQPRQTAKRGTTVHATFVSGHPRNNVMHGRTFLTVEKLVDGNKWKVVATDADWETKFYWKKTVTLIGGSEATVEWSIPKDAAPGTYRLRHFGNYKALLGGVYPYNGSSDHFQVV